MDAKDLRTESALGDRTNDGNTKYSQGSTVLQCNRNKPYQDIGSNSLAKVDVQTARPCAVIGPDRVVPPSHSIDAYLKKGTLEPWPGADNVYRRPPEYPHKISDYHHPTRNISPRQTFQENMSRIMVPPSYNSAKIKEDHNFPVDANVSTLRNNKLSVPTEAKYCDVPYSVNPMTSEQKNIRNADISASNMNPALARSAPHGWPTANSANIRPPKPYGAPDLYQYTEYQSCAGPRPLLMPRPHRTVHEEPGHVYSEPYYQEGSIRFKPYPSVKERFPQTRYEYIGNYSNPFHPPPPFPSHKYDLQKPLPHAYPGYAQVPLKYLDSRMADPVINGYQRPLNQQGNFSAVPYRNQVIHPAYGPVPSNCLQPNKYYPYPPDNSVKAVASNKLPYDTNHKIYGDYENARTKTYPLSESFYINEMTRPHLMKGQVLPPNYPPVNMHTIPTHSYYRKENPTMKGYDYGPHFRNIDPSINISGGSTLSRLPSQFSPNAIAISPSDSNTSNDTTQTQGTSQEDCGYVSQSSSVSIRSMDSGINRMPNDLYRRYDYYRFGPGLKSSPLMSKPEVNHSLGSKNKKDIDVRQFLQMWNEGEEENGENTNKEVTVKSVSNNTNDISNQPNSQEQLYVLGLVNVPSEELDKYEHIQKVSKLPENIKGYNSIELLNQFEEVIESSNLNKYNVRPQVQAPRDFYMSSKGSPSIQGLGIPSRPISPLDVEAKISQSVIHKEVGCNFEIRPCSPKMLNVEVAAPIQTILGERVIEKVTNPLITPSPILHGVDENIDNCNIIKQQDRRISLNENTKVPSCKMINTQFSNNDAVDSMKTNYSLQDLESNSGVCLASLPRLDNDIELNFPEVNQQFINANKVESVITTTLKDLPALDMDQSETLQDRPIQEVEISHQFSPNVELEKEFSKLSKYRKLKKKGSDPKDNNSDSNAQAMRTDSVIIKNPENIKTQEVGHYSPSVKNLVQDTQQDPINLTIHAEDRASYDETEPNINKPIDDKPNEVAIDFSLHSNEQFHVKDPPDDKCDSKEEYLSLPNADPSSGNSKKNVTFIESLNDNLHKNKIETSTCEENKSKVYAQHDNKYFNEMSNHCGNKTTMENSIDAFDKSVKSKTNIKDCKEGAATDLLHGTHISNIEEYSKHSFVNKCDLTITRNSPSPDCNSRRDVSVKNSKNPEMVLENENEVSKLLTNKTTSSSKILEINEQFNNLPENNIFSHDLKCVLDNVIYSEQEDREFIDQKNISKIKSDRNESNCITILNQMESDIQDLEKELKSTETYVSVEETGDTNISFSKIIFHIRKELFSPWIQKLILHNEGPLNATNSKNDIITISDEVKTDDKSLNFNTRSENILQQPKKDKVESSDTQNQDYEMKVDHVSIEPISVESRNVLEGILNNDKCSIVSTNSIDTYMDIVMTNNTATEPISCEPKSYQPIIEPRIDVTSEILDITNNEMRESSETNSESGANSESDTTSPVMSSGIVVEDSSCNNTSTDKNQNYETMMYSKKVETLSKIENTRTNINETVTIKSVSKVNNKDVIDSKINISTTDTEATDACIETKSPDITSDKSVPETENDFNIVGNATLEPSSKSQEIDLGTVNAEVTTTKPISRLEESDLVVDVKDTRMDSSTTSKSTLEATEIDVFTHNVPIVSNAPSIEIDLCVGNALVNDTLISSEIDDSDDNAMVKSIDKSTSVTILAHQCAGIEPDTKTEIESIESCLDITSSKPTPETISDVVPLDTEFSDCTTKRTEIDSCTNEVTGKPISETNDIELSFKDSKVNINNSLTELESISNFEIETDIVNESNETKALKIPKSDNYLNNNNVIVDDSTSQSNSEVNSCMNRIIMVENRVDIEGKYNESVPENVEGIDEELNLKQNELETNKCSAYNQHVNIEVDNSKDIDDPMEKNTKTNTSGKSIFMNGDLKQITLSSTDTISTDNLDDTDATVATNENNETNLESHVELCTDCNATGVNQLKETQLLDSFKKIRQGNNISSNKKRKSLKRSLSDSALAYSIDYLENSKIEDSNNGALLWPNKRKRNMPENITEPQIIAESYCNIIHHNRRNSISSIYNEENVSICILIDNDCILTEDSDETQKICFTELPEECLSCIQSDASNVEGITESTTEIISLQEEINYEYPGSFAQEVDCTEEDSTFDESWVEDVACVETVVSDDIAEDFVSPSASPKDVDLSDGESNDDEAGIFAINNHSDKLKYIYGDKMCNDDAQLVETLYRTPQMNVNKTLVCRESHVIEDCNRYYDKESLEKVLSESNVRESISRKLDGVAFGTTSHPPTSVASIEEPDGKDNSAFDNVSGYSSPLDCKRSPINVSKMECHKSEENVDYSQMLLKTQDDTVHSCESSVDNVFSYIQCEESPRLSSSPEVSSTTSEEKNSCILLKITNYRGSRTAQVNNIHTDNNSNRVSCKYTEKKDYLNSNLPNRPLITKAAQKYIPPLKETIGDLKVQLSLPQHSLLKLKQLKISKERPKINLNKRNIVNMFRKDIPKKPKPKFEDVLKSIDEIQFKMHKEKSKKIKKSIPKVVIKKNVNGSHYASTSNKDSYNPDLTGRKWQPWVFLEKNQFIDEMALKNKTRAIFSHRKNTYVLAETFKKYKAMSSAKFVISQPKSDDSTGHLKYTIRLKHSY